jgi:hypothetical protein
MADEQKSTKGAAQGRKFLGVMFECCNAYARVYLNRDGSAYAGRCPRCTKSVRFKVSAEGTGSDRRFWSAR